MREISGYRDMVGDCMAFVACIEEDPKLSEIC